MVDRVTLGVEETPPDDPSVEAVGTEENVMPLEETPQEETEEETSDRPEWLQEKFESPEALAQAYEQLEKKMSSGRAEAEGLLTPDEFDAYNDEYNEKGGLQDTTYAALEKKGISRDLVDNYIQGQNSLNEAHQSGLLNLVGGEANYDAMTEWASENIEAAELDAYNEAITGEIATASLAIKGLWSQFTNTTGEASAPQLIQGGKAPSVGGYGSTYEMKQDMKDPRYQAGDKNWHAHVEKRLSMTSGEVI
jgi:hypothetical protein